ncbi:DUF4276 family protein [Amycolatopsis sp. NPDC049159]|uniref:DUF4276 family protein n=1 Tax=unclassified Amycolatopsis TaxID=2618356 RepID=UPI0033F4FE2F
MIHVEILVEEQSAEAALKTLVPKIVGEDVSFAVRRFQGKQDLLKRLPGILRGFAARISWEALRVVVLVDRDTEDCRELKRHLVEVGEEAGLPSEFILHRVVIDELESWFLGDVPALCAAYDKVPKDLGKQARYRDPDDTGKASRALEDLLRSKGYLRDRLPKVAAAEAIAPHMDIENNRSKSFQVFRDGLRRLVKEGN